MFCIHDLGDNVASRGGGGVDLGLLSAGGLEGR